MNSPRCRQTVQDGTPHAEPAVRARELEWISVGASIPDADTTVLVYAERADDPVWLGFYDTYWHYVDGSPADGVTHWAEMPEGPR